MMVGERVALDFLAARWSAALIGKASLNRVRAIRKDAMSQIAGPTVVLPRQLATFYAPVQEDLKRVDALLRGELRSNCPHVNDLVRYSFRIGGKRLRPALLLLSAKAVGDVTEAHVTLAAVVEMIHTGTLIHDDILDEATLRRHHATINARWDNERSVLLGDFLFTHAFYLASTLSSTYACRMIGRATNTVCEGELRQTASCGNFDLTEGDYLDIIEAKTAELCACCCQLGAHYAGADSRSEERLGQFGRHLGVAFQIADDLLDLLGDEPTVGKSLGTDLGKRKPTLPLIEAFRQVPPKERCQLMAIVAGSDGSVGSLIPWLERLGAVDYAREKARSYAQRARDCLAALPSSPAREMLRRLADYVVTRPL
jgi:octaprenyl-diphosphate synthase